MKASALYDLEVILLQIEEISTIITKQQSINGIHKMKFQAHTRMKPS